VSLPKLHVGIVDLDGADEPVLRPYLESLECRVVVYRIGRANDLIAVLSGQELYPKTDHLILDCHGDEGSILIPELDPSVLAPGEPNRVFSVDHVLRFAKLPPLVVLATGCTTGSATMAEAFLWAGASGYLAPDGYPNGAEGRQFELEFYYEVLHHRRPEREAALLAQRVGGDAHLYRWYARS
jgi:hypothetical protein